MLQHLAAKDGIKAGIRLGNGCNVADNIDARIVPNRGLEPFIYRAPRSAVVLGEVLRYVDKMATMLSVLEFASASIEQTQASGNFAQYPS